MSKTFLISFQISVIFFLYKEKKSGVFSISVCWWPVCNQSSVFHEKRVLVQVSPVSLWSLFKLLYLPASSKMILKCLLAVSWVHAHVWCDPVVCRLRKENLQINFPKLLTISSRLCLYPLSCPKCAMVPGECCLSPPPKSLDTPCVSQPTGLWPEIVTTITCPLHLGTLSQLLFP